MKIAAAVLFSAMVLLETSARAEPPKKEDDRLPGQRSGTSRLIMNEVPEDVRQTINKHASSGTIEDIDKGSVSNRVVYQVVVKQNQHRRTLLIGANGELLKDTRTTGVAELGTSVGARLENFPYDVQNAVRNALGDAKVISGKRELIDGQSRFRVTFQREGERSTASFSPDGKLLELNSRKAEWINWTLVPHQVEQTLRKEGALQYLLSASTDKQQNRTAYRFHVLRGGDIQQLVITEDGKLLEEAKISFEAAGASSRPEK